MDYNTLLDLTTELGYQLAISGAETFRVEETITRIFAAYEIQVEVFSIPNCLIISLETCNNEPMTRMRRIGHHGTDLDAVEKYNNLSRRICAEKPEPQQAMDWLKDIQSTKKEYGLLTYLIGNMVASIGFTFLFKGSLIDSLCAGICGLLIGLINRLMLHFKVNAFFSTIASAFVGATCAYLIAISGLAPNPDAVIISCLMLLVPGLLFTNALRDIIYGDTNSGINRIVQVLLIGVAIALGTGAAWRVALPLGANEIINTPTVNSVLLCSLASIFACLGFNVLFNIQGYGGIFCALGGGFTWAIYGITLEFSQDIIFANFLATLGAALYSEIMARIRKYPAISYLVVSVIPLLPGAGVYYTTNSFLVGDMTGFTAHGTETLGIAGAMAVAILIVSTLARLWNVRKHHRLNKH